jgi:hypothetical protein
LKDYRRSFRDRNLEFPVTERPSTVLNTRRRKAKSARRRRLWLSVGASLACHLVGFTLLAGRQPIGPRIPAALDGVFAVDATTPAARIEDHAPPPRARPAPVPRPALRRQGRAAHIRRTVASQAPPAPLAPPAPVEAPPAPVAPTPPQSGSGVDRQAPAPAASPPLVTAAVARSLRVYDTFPRMPEILRMAPHAELVEAEICVSERGSVNDVRLRGGSGVLERVLRDAITSWRYRPYVVGGVATPFCHVLRLAYRAQDRSPYPGSTP